MCNTMIDYEEYNNSWLAVVCHIIFAVVSAAIIILFLASCKTQYVPVETTHTIYHNHTDSVHLIDSVYREKETVIREANSGDSALLAKLGIQLRQNQKAILILQKELERERNKQEEHYGDTIIKVEEKQVPVPVEKKVPFLEKAKLASIGFSASLILIAAIGLVIWIRKRYRRK